MASKKCLGIDHIQIGVKNISQSGPFYDQLLKYFGFKVLSTRKNYRNWHNGGRNTFSIKQVAAKHARIKYHRKQIGLNHIAFRATTKSQINAFYKDFLVKHNIPVLYGGPKSYPEYYEDYYAVYFEDPDRIKLEYMWFRR